MLHRPSHTTRRCLLFLLCHLAFLLPSGAQTDTLRLMFAGDIMGHTEQIKSAEVSPGNYDYSPCFRYIKPILERADLAIGNLELTLPGKGPYTGYPMFRSPDALANALKDAGFDILLTGNNHCNDSRGAGVVHTIQTLRDKGFLQTGTFKNQRDRDAFYPLMVYKKGFKLALLNYTYGTNGVPTDPPTVVNLIDTIQIARDLAEARARKPHYIIVVMHWGLETQLQENAQQRQLALFLIRNGADIVIGSHPHVVQPIRTETAALPDGSPKTAVVVYSLGNFISDQQTPGTNSGILFHLDLLHHKGVPYAELGQYGYQPVWRYRQQQPNGKTAFYTLPVAPYEHDAEAEPGLTLPAQDEMRKFAEGVRKRLKGCREWE